MRGIFDPVSLTSAAACIRFDPVLGCPTGRVTGTLVSVVLGQRVPTLKLSPASQAK